MPFGVLVALDDFFLRNLGEGVAVSHALHIPDGFPGGLVNLPKANRVLRRNSGDKPDRDQDEGQSEISRPQGWRSHERQLELMTRSPNLVA